MPLNAGVDLTVASTQTDVFTNGATEFTLNFNLLNRNTSPVLVDVWLVKSGGSASNANKLEHQRPIRAKGIYERWAITLGPGDKIVALSTKTAVNFLSWGAA